MGPRRYPASPDHKPRERKHEWGRLAGRTKWGQELLTIVDSRHGGHPEIGVVLVVESVAVPVHGVVEARVIPDG